MYIALINFYEYDLKYVHWFYIFVAVIVVVVGKLYAIEEKSQNEWINLIRLNLLLLP